MLVRRSVERDRAAWDRLYMGYAGFYGVAQTPGMQDRVWGWIHDPAHKVEGFVAEDGGALVGLAQVRAFARPLSATVGGFLDDLFVTPEARRGGAAEALIQWITDRGQ